MFGLGEDRELPTVLLIDDDLISREVIATLLTMRGYILHTATEGAEALKMLDTGQCAPQVILVDVLMPGLNGLPLIEELRARSRAGIYAISGSQPPEDVRNATDGFLQKPFGPEALQRLLQEQALEGHTVPAPESSEPVVSAEILAQFRQLMPEPTVREIYLAVTTDLEKRIAALESAIARGDSAEIRRIGHAIKGGCGMAGALEAARLGARFESGSTQLDDYDALVSDLRVATHKLENMLKVEFPA